MGNENAVSAQETLAHEEEDPTIDNEGAYHVSELKRYAPLLPLIAGLACSRVGLNASVYSNYAQTDAGFISDGTVLAALIVFAPLLFAITKLNEPLSKAFVNRSATAVFALETICVALLEYGTLFPLQEAVRFVIAAICTITSTCAMYYWLRRARGGGVIIGATLVFSAIAASELILMLVNCLPAGSQAIIATVISAAQFPAQHIAKRTSNPFQLVKNNEPRSAYSLKASIRNKRLLASSALGVAALGLTIGLLRGYPNGQPIAFDPASRTAYMLVTVVICMIIVLICLSGKTGFMTTGIWIMLLCLACLAITSFAAFPDSLSIGAVFATSLNALTVGYCYYLTIEFMTHGWRDPYYYAFSGWIVYFVTRAFARIVLSNITPLNSNAELTLAIMADAVVASALIIFVRFLNDAKTPAQELPDVQTSPLQKAVALSSPEEQSAIASLREDSFAAGIAALKKQYQLSERETEVISLYAQGHTQKKIASELFITPGTVHEHIRHAYTKTGLHSRQQILDFIHEQ